MIFTFGKGTGGKGVYITVTCDSAYQGYNIICTTGSVSKTKTCGSNNTVKFSFSENEVSTLPATFTISNSLNSITQIETASMYGWYETILNYGLYLLYNGSKVDNLIDFPTSTISNYGYSSTHPVGINSVVKSNDTFDITVSGSASWSRWGIGTTNKINVSNYSMVNCLINDIKYSVDISSKNGDYYVGIFGYSANNDVKGWVGISNSKTTAEATDTKISSNISFGRNATLVKVKSIWLE